MNSQKLFYVLLTSLILIIVAFSGVIVYGNKFLSTKAETLQNKKAEYKSIESKQLATTKLKKDIAKYSDLNEIGRAHV